MKRNTWFNLLMVLGLILALGGGIVMARRAQAQGPGPEGPLGTQAAVGTAFTYQGRLEDASGPVDGTCGFGLSLYGSSGGADQIGTTQDKPGVSVSNGYFTVTDLDFGASAFDGNARYLEIAVDCGSGPATLSPRVALNAAPYAHSLRPGAKVESTGTALQLTTSATSGDALNVIASAVSGNAAAVYGGSSSSGGAGLSGYNSSSGYGVYGSSTSGYGVYGKSGIASGKPTLVGVGVWGDGASSPGVYGTSNSAAGVFGWSTSNAGVGGLSDSGNAVEGTSISGVGVYGTASTTGTVGIATGSSGTNYGVYGRNATYAGAGVYGESSYSSGTGVRGYSAAGPGVEGSSTSSNGVVGSSTSGNGVWGYSTSGHAIYSEGDTHINGDLTWSTRTGYVAVSAAAFRPQDEGYDYTNHGYQLGTSTTDSEYYAHVQLPHGANVTKVTFYWYDTFGGLIDARCRLYRNDMANNEEQQMAEVWSFGDSGDGSSDTSSITYPDIDNEHYSYYLEWVLDSQLWGYGVVITYEYTEPY